MTNVWRLCSRRLLAALLLAVTAASAQAHKASDAYLQLQSTAQGTQLRVDVALRDLDLALDLDVDGDARLSWREVRMAWPAIEAYLRERVQVAGCDWSTAARMLEKRVDGVYAAVSWRSDCRLATPPPIRYTVLREVDPTHRGLARITTEGRPSVLRVLDPTRTQALDASPPGSSTMQAGQAAGTAAAASPAALAPLLREGIEHILTGYDHVLFLLCLLLPSVMRRAPGGWQPVQRRREALWPVLGIVTAFTVAHSITLGLAASRLVAVPPSVIEPAIAITIVLAAIDNLWPLFRGRRAVVTFLFGLVHGFGFAGVLAELNLPPWQFGWALLQFNLGLELGQLLIVAVAVCVLFAMRRARRYPAWVLQGGSCAAMFIGGLWFVERTTNLSVMGF